MQINSGEVDVDQVAQFYGYLSHVQIPHQVLSHLVAMTCTYLFYCGKKSLTSEQSTIGLDFLSSVLPLPAFKPPPPPFIEVDITLLVKSILILASKTFFPTKFNGVPNDPASLNLLPLADKKLFEFTSGMFEKVTIDAAQPSCQILQTPYHRALAALAEKDPVLAEEICTGIISLLDSSIEAQYIAISLLLVVPPIAGCHALNKSGAWSKIVNQAAFMPLKDGNSALVDCSRTLFWRFCCQTTSDLSQFLIACEPLIVSDLAPYVLPQIALLANYNPSKLAAEIKGTRVIDRLFDLDDRCFYTIIASKTTRKDLVNLRSLFLAMVPQLARTTVGLVGLLGKQQISIHLFSLLLNDVAQPIIMKMLAECITLCRGTDDTHSYLKALVVQSINEIIKVSISLAGQPKWKDLVVKLFHLLTSHIPDQAITHGFVVFHVFSTISKIVETCVDDRPFCLKIFASLVTLCSSSVEITTEMRNPTYNILETWKPIFAKQSDLSTLLEFTFLEKTTLKDEDRLIRNPEGLRLLIWAALQTPQAVDIIKYIAKISASSPFNLNRCYQSGILLNLLDYSQTHPENIIPSFITTVGKSFIGSNELRAILSMLANADKPYAMPLLQSLETIALANDDNASSFFHIDKRSSLQIPHFKVSKIEISMRLRLDASCFRTPTPIIHIRNAAQSFQLECRESGLFFGMIGPNPLTLVTKSLPKNQFFSLRLFVQPKSASVHIDSVEVARPTFQTIFNFGEVVQVTCDKFVGDIVSLRIADNNTPIAEYSASVMRGGKCPNLITGKDLIGPAMFEGYAVTYSIRLPNAVSNLGGVNIFLPVFEASRKSSEPVKFICLLLEIIHALVRSTSRKGALMLDTNIFRALSHFLCAAPDIHVKIIQILLDIYASLSFNELRTELLFGVFLNTNFWNRCDQKVLEFLLITCLPQIYSIDKALYIEECSIANYIYLVVYFFASHTLIHDVFNIILAIDKEHFSFEDCRMLFGAAVDSEHPQSSLEAITVLLMLIKAKSPIALEFLSKYGTFEPFGVLLSSPVPEIQSATFLLLSTLNTIDPAADLSRASFSLMMQCTVLPTVENTIDELYNFIYGSTDFTQPRPIRNARFLPLAVFLLKAVSQKKRDTFSAILRASFQLEGTQLTILQCTHWVFWIIFVASIDTCADEWLAIIGKVIAKNLQYKRLADLREIMHYIYIACEIYKWSWSQCVRTIFANVPPDQQSVEFVFEYLFFIPKIDTFLKPPQPLHQKVTEVHLFASDLVRATSMEAAFSLMLRFDGKTWQDAQLASDYVAYLLSARKDQFSKPFLYGIPTFVYIAVALHGLATTKTQNVDSLVGQFIANIKGCDKSMMKQCLLMLCNDFKQVAPVLKKFDSSMNENAIASNAPLALGGTLAIITESVAAYTPVFNEGLAVVFDRLKTDLMNLFDSASQQSLTLQKIPFEFRRRVTLCAERGSASERRSSVIWGRAMRQMGRHSKHWMIDQSLDAHGRRMHMRPNHHFTDHMDASKARNDGCNEGEKEIKTFDMLREESNDTVLLSLKCRMIKVTEYLSGSMIFTPTGITFDAEETTDAIGRPKEHTQQFVDIDKNSVEFVLTRRYLHEDVGAEIFTTTRKSYLFVFSTGDRKTFLQYLLKLKLPNVKVIQTKSSAKTLSDLGFTKMWQNGQMTNYEYLFWLNMLSGRSFNDLSQYPVFPWVLNDYTSLSLDFEDSTIYRDLSRPIAALNADRLENMHMLYNELDTPDKCLYRLHYSTPGYVIHYLIRQEPFTTLHIELQNGRFDYPARLFRDVAELWKVVTSSRSSDWRELIPEFYSLPEFLMNTENFDLGKVPDGPVVNDVDLPPWAANADIFVYKMRLALESQFVSSHLNEWIDLVWGFKQQSLEFDNFFHPYSSSDAMEKFPEEVPMIREHVANFGVTPEKLFPQPHVARSVNSVGHLNQTISFEKIAQADHPILRLGCERDRIVGMTKYSIFALEKSGCHNFQKVTYPEELANVRTVPRFCAFLGRRGDIAIASPWKTTFDVLINGKMKTMTPHHITTISTLAAAGKIAVTGGDDGAVNIWSLETDRAYTIVAHSNPIAATAYNAALDIAVTIDTIGLVALSYGERKKFLRSFQTSAKPSSLKIAISDQGFITICWEEQDLDVFQTHIEDYDLMGRSIGFGLFPGSCTVIELCTLRNTSEYIFVGMKTGEAYLLQLPDLLICAKGHLPGTVYTMAYSPDSQTIYGAIDSALFSFSLTQ